MQTNTGDQTFLLPDPFPGRVLGLHHPGLDLAVRWCFGWGREQQGIDSSEMVVAQFAEKCLRDPALWQKVEALFACHLPQVISPAQ